MKMVEEQNRASRVSHHHEATIAARTAYLMGEIKIFIMFS